MISILKSSAPVFYHQLLIMLIGIISIANTIVSIVYVLCVCICLCSGANFLTTTEPGVRLDLSNISKAYPAHIIQYLLHISLSCNLLQYFEICIYTLISVIMI